MAFADTAIGTSTAVSTIESVAVDRQLPESRGGDVINGKVDISLPGKGNSNCHGARPVH